MRGLLAVVLVCGVALAEGEQSYEVEAPAIATGESPKQLKVYRTPAARFTVTMGPTREHRLCMGRDVTFPSPGNSRWPTITGKLYTPKKQPAKPMPAAIVLAHTGGSFFLEDMVARHLAGHGVVSVFIDLPNYGKRRIKGTPEGFTDPDRPETVLVGYRQAVLDTIRTGDALRGLPGVDPKRVGVLGVSLGAVVGSVARGVDTRLDRTYLVIPGGNLRRIFETSWEVALPPKVLALLPDLSPYDPLTFGPRVDPADVLMLCAARDEVIPPECGEQLWEAMNKPKLEWIDCGHYGVLLHFPRVMNDALDWFTQRGATESPGSLEPSGASVPRRLR